MAGDFADGGFEGGGIGMSCVGVHGVAVGSYGERHALFLGELSRGVHGCLKMEQWKGWRRGEGMMWDVVGSSVRLRGVQ